MKTIAVCNEHHGALYFDVSTSELMEAFCLSLLRGKTNGKNADYIIEHPIPEPVRPTSLTDEQIQAMPTTDPVRFSAEQILQKYKTKLENWGRNQRQFLRTQEALRTNNGRKALEIVKTYYYGYNEGDVHFETVSERYPGDEL